MSIVIDIEAIVLIMLLPLNGYYAWHGLGLYRAVPSPFLRALFVAKLAIFIFSLPMAFFAGAYLVHPPPTPVTWIGIAFAGGVILIELVPAYIHYVMVNVLTEEDASMRGETILQQQDRMVGDERRRLQSGEKRRNG